jgi:phosphatidylethanolamine-binding protein (PEBP) family uncharacterized protein
MLKFFLVAAATAAMLSAEMMVSAAGAMSLNFSWNGVQACNSTSPAFSLSGVPKDTKQLAFQMVDKNVPSYQHGGGTVAYQGNAVPAGSFSYTGPCPPSGQHTYQWTVQALDGASKVLATAVSSRPFPPR